MGQDAVDIENAHTQRMYAIFDKRAETMNSIYSLAIVFVFFIGIFALVAVAGLSFWVWRWAV
jgi:Cu/Ag efflux pump CusA